MKSAFFLMLAAAAALPLQAASFVVPSDRELIHRSDAIVLGSALTSYSQLNPAGGIETVTPISVSRVIRGGVVTTTINVVEPGGTYGDTSMIIGGVPQFTPGDRLLLFLRRTGADRWAVTDLVLGKFRYATDTRSRELLVRDADEINGWDPTLQLHREPLRAATPFLRFVDNEAHGVPDVDDYFVKEPAPFRMQSTSMTAAPTATFTATSYTMTISGSMGSRWAVFPNAVTLYASASGEPGAPGGGTTAVQTAINSWDGDCPSNVNYVYGGTDSTHTQGLHAPDGANTVLFERDLSTWGVTPFSCSTGGTLGIGGITSASGTNVVSGETFVTTQEADVEMNRGIANCTTLFNSGDWNTAVTHEVGHTLGFRHSDQNRPGNAACSTDPSLECSTQAVMKSFIPTGINAALQTWDQHAVQAVYPGGTCGAVGGPPKRGDLDGNGRSDILWHTPSTGANTVWYVSSSGLLSELAAPAMTASYTLVGVGDFNHDGRADILWRDLGSGAMVIWFMNGATRIGTMTLPTISPVVAVVGVGDFNGDGYADIFWRNTQTGENSVWYITASGFSGGLSLPSISDQNLKIVSVADFNGDGRADILWRNMATGDNYIWILNLQGQIVGGQYLGTIPLSVTLAGTGDFNGDGTFDLLWRNTQTGDTSVWFIHNGAFIGGGFDFGNVPLNGVKIVGVGDFNGDGTYDILWRNENTGENSIWFITANGFSGGATLPNIAGTSQKIVSPPPL